MEPSASYTSIGEPLRGGVDASRAMATQPAALPGSTDPPPVPFDDPYRYPERKTPASAMSAWVPPPPKCCYKKRIGRLYVFAANSDGSPRIIMGPCWPMWFLTFTLIAGPTTVVLAIFGSRLLYLWIPALCVALVTLVAFCATGCRNPGIVPRHGEMNDNDDLWDDRGQTYRPRYSMYDLETGVVVEQVDHFCPWTGTLIGKGNILAFHVFTSSLCILCPFVAGILIWGIVTSISLPPNQN